MKVIYFLLLVVIINGCKNNNNTINVLFDKVDGISTDTKVFLNGVEIGEVKSFELINYKVLTKLNLGNDIKIPTNSKFLIRNNFLSNSVIIIEPSKNNSWITNKDTLLGIFENKKILDNFISDSNNQKKADTVIKRIIYALDSVLKEGD